VGARAPFDRSRLAAAEALLKMPKSSRVDLIPFDRIRGLDASLRGDSSIDLLF
jgi:hypothetical protein